MSFNSSMVRLKALLKIELPQCEDEFQFLYGAIKSEAQTVQNGKLKRFNSSMVRLKVYSRIYFVD